MQYEEYSVEDFLFDEFFVRWVKKPGPETEHFWTAWIKEHPEKVHTIRNAKEIIESIKYKSQYFPSDQEYNDVLENVLKPPASWSQIGYNKKNDRLTSVVKYAAALLVVVGLVALSLFLNSGNAVMEEYRPIAMVEKINPNGQKTTVVLADGTTVRLNAGSKLVYRKEFFGRERKVWLEGEAFFDVKRDASRPFIVQTKDLTTTVLGTSFNIKSYADENESLVAVASGKVKVIKGEGGRNHVGPYFLLRENQMISYNAVDNSLTKTESVPENVFAWKSNIIQFDHADFEQIIKKLQRWYGVEFFVTSKNTFAGRFNAKYKDEPLDLVLEGLKGEYGFEYRIEGKNVYIN
ncbi:MAG: FecR domain-containing protein [Cytophagales bacterium]|nr:FecR domain-containing protein [Cytophagales bacterium]